MPVIPIVQEQQQMNVSSPVEIGSASSPGAAAMDNLGRAMASLGNELDKVQKAQKAKLDRESVKIALAEYWQVQNDYAQETLFKKDRAEMPTGLNAIKELRANGEEARKKFLESKGFNAEQALMFQGGSKDIDNDFTPGVMKKSAEIWGELNASERQHALLMSASIAAKDPAKYLELSVNIESENDNDPTVLNSFDQTRKDKIVLNKATIEYSLRQGKYGNAKWFLEQAVKEAMYTPEEQGEIYKEIVSAQRGDAAEYRAKTGFDQGQADRIRSEKNREAKQNLAKDLVAAGSSQSRLNAVLDTYTNNPYLEGDDIINGREWMSKAARPSDDAYEIAFRSRLMNPNVDIRELEAELRQDMKGTNGKVTFEQGVRLQALLQDAAKFNRDNPNARNVVSAYANLVESQFAPDPFSADAQFYKPENNQALAAALSFYQARIYEAGRDGTVTESEAQAAYDSTVRKVQKPNIKNTFIPRGTGARDFKDSESADRTIRALDIKFMREKNKMTPREKIEHQRARDQAVQKRDQARREEKAAIKPSSGSSGDLGKTFDDK